MPLFDYRCADCKKRFSLLIGVVAQAEAERCPHCGSTRVGRMISRFARLRSEDDLIDGLADPAKIGDLEDPRQLHSWMKHASKEMGEDFADDFDEALDEIEQSEREEPGSALDDGH